MIDSSFSCDAGQAYSVGVCEVYKEEKGEEMSTYKNIRSYVKDKYGFDPKSCWIADAKERFGLPVKRAWNRKGEERENPCPDEKLDAIRDAIEYFGMLEG